ncbi:39S ribosomal protein L1, mitochondrial [Anabarilius grahami]|uniref:39S ribosomal protein L1, mitochondrial n=1 Tax=Anabarilius grahami TaxID=495550 RepID=A0A3N0ZAS6_ANAGA|nr:39S ribosomal protein L1, mitochondrial [Anabarilius grahami]
MAAPSRSVLRVLPRCQSLLTCRAPSVSLTAHRQQPVRSYAATKPKEKKEEKVQEKVVKEKKKVDDKDRHKPYGLTAWAPVDDVYLVRYYPKPVYETPVAIEMLKSFQKLDFSLENQPVYINLRLDMKLEKKKKVDPFVSTMHLPHPFRSDNNRIVVFTENPDQARIAMENGATVAGGAELIDKLDMPKECILENIHAIVKDVASHKPAEFGPLIDRALICSRSSEGLNIKIEELLPQEEKKA